jgi:hypothetical protein
VGAKLLFGSSIEGVSSFCGILVRRLYGSEILVVVYVAWWLSAGPLQSWRVTCQS